MAQAKPKENPAWLGQRSDGFHHQRVGFFREFESKFSMNGWCWFRNGHRSASQNGFKRKKLLEDEIQQHVIPQIVLVKGRSYFMLSIFLCYYIKGVYAGMMNKNSSLFFLRSFTLCRAGVSVAILYSGGLQASQQDESAVPTTDTNALWRDDQWRNSTKGTIEWGGHLLGPPKKMGVQQIREDPIRKEGQTVKKKVTTEKGWSVFSLQTFFHGNQTLVSVLVQKWLWIGVCVRTWFPNPLVPEFSSTIIMRTEHQMDSVSLR